MLFALYSARHLAVTSDALNRQGVPYSSEIPLWNKHKIKRMLENARYTGKDGYPVMIAETDFQAVQDKISEKNDRRQVSEEVTVVDRLKPYFRCTCGGKMVRLGGRWQDRSKVYLKCEHCGISRFLWIKWMRRSKKLPTKCRRMNARRRTLMFPLRRSFG